MRHTVERQEVVLAGGDEGDALQDHWYRREVPGQGPQLVVQVHGVAREPLLPKRGHSRGRVAELGRIHIHLEALQKEANGLGGAGFVKGHGGHPRWAKAARPARA